MNMKNAVRVHACLSQYSEAKVVESITLPRLKIEESGVALFEDWSEVAVNSVLAKEPNITEIFQVQSFVAGGCIIW